MGWNQQFVKWWFRRLVRWIHIWVHIYQFEVFFSFQLRIMELPTLEVQDQPEAILFDLKKP